MSTPSRAQRVIHTLVGELPEKSREEGIDGLLWLVGLFGFFAMFIGEYKDLHGPPLSQGAWRGMVHAGIPLMCIAVWQMRESSRGRAPALMGALVICGVFIVQYFVDGGRNFLRKESLAVIVPAVIGVGLLLYGLRRAGTNFAEWGASLGDTKFWVPRAAIVIAILVPTLFLVVYLSPMMAKFYPTHRPARKETIEFVLLSTGQLLDFMGWEFFFRGFLLFAIARRGDVRLAILFQAFPFFLLHAGKPHVELVMSFFGAVVSGWFCYRARTFLPLLILHWVQIVTVGLAANIYRWY